MLDTGYWTNGKDADKSAGYNILNERYGQNIVDVGLKSSVQCLASCVCC